jgi:hypothetical protein
MVHKKIERLELSAVVFIRTYLQLRFDGAALTIVTTTTKVASGAAWFRDRFRYQISRTA